MSLIIQPRKELYIESKINIGMKGFFRLRTVNARTGKRRIDTGWFPNTILDAGRNVMATRSDWMTYCQVGTDGTFPATVEERRAETSLGGRVAGTNQIVLNQAGQAGSAPYYGWRRKTFRHNPGTVVANLSEVGVGWGASGSTLISRAPILDPVLQTPTTITPLADEYLDVLYELRYYVPTVDVLGPQVVLDGVTYDTTTRAANATSARWSEYIGSAIGVYADGNNWIAYDGLLGTILTAPNGASAVCGANAQFDSAYQNNSYSLQLNCPVPSNGWNLGSGIRSVKIRTKAGDYQTQFDSNPGNNRIPKTVDYTMSMSWTISWAEYE